MTFVHALAAILQCVPAYLLLCILGNFSSILSPMAMSMGSMKPVQPKLAVILVQMLVMMLAPLCLAPALLALAAEAALAEWYQIHGIPICLVVTLVELLVVRWAYGRVIAAQGRMLQQREPRILEIVAAVVE
jgi:hypothetical protein